MTALDTRGDTRGDTRSDTRSTRTRRGALGAASEGRPAVPTSPLPSETLLALARRGLVQAGGPDQRPCERYALAHLAALRTAAAVLACRARPAAPRTRRSRPTSAWVLLSAVAPELREWADFFAAGARKRAAAEAGLPVVSVREADDLVRDAERFLAVVETALGLPHQPLLGPG